MGEQMAIDNRTLEVFKIVHRSPDDLIPITRIKDGQFQKLATVTTKELANMLPAIRDYILQDSYFGVNSIWSGYNRYTNNMTGFQDTKRGKEKLTRLNMCFVDLDTGRTDVNGKPVEGDDGLSYFETVARLMHIVSLELLPPPTMIASSGRGVYVFWLLEGESEPGIGERAFPANRALYERINKALIEQLLRVAPDRSAYDAARILRIPGSIHSKAKKTVSYQMPLYEDGKPKTYSLKELASFLRVPLKESKVLPSTRKTKVKGKAPERAKGLMSLYLKRLTDIVTVEAHTGGFKQGRRRRSIFAFCVLLRGAKRNKRDALLLCYEMAGRCDPPYPTDEKDVSVKSIVDEIFGLQKSGKQIIKPSFKIYSNAQLCRLYGITESLAKSLDLLTIKPLEIDIQEPKPRAIKKKIRIQALQELIDIHGKGYGCRKFVEALSKRGIKTNRQTVNEDLKGLYPSKVLGAERRSK
jgi:hypothetical protein